MRNVKSNLPDTFVESATSLTTIISARKFSIATDAESAEWVDVKTSITAMIAACV